MLFDLFRARSVFSSRSARRSRFQQPTALVQSLEERVLLMANAVSEELRLNTQTTGRQETAGFQSSLDTAPDGTGVIVWTSQADGRRSQEILGQRLDALGRPVGDIFTISATPDRQEQASVAVDDDGSFVVVWQRWKGDGSGWAVIGQRFKADATKAGNEFRINATTRGDQEQPGASYLENGNFVVTWQGRGADDRQGVYARVFSDSGSPVTGEIVVSQISRGLQTNSVVSADPDGGFLIAWSGRGADDRNGVYARRFDETVTPLGGQFQVNTRERWSQEQPSASFASNGDFVIVWQSRWQDGWGWSVFGQRFLADGTREGNEFLINETVKSRQLAPHVDYLQDRNFLVAWQGRGLGDRYGSYAREFGSSGQPTTGEFLVNTTTSRRQQSASVAATPQGYLVGWSGNGVGDRDGVFIRQIVSHMTTENQAPVLTNPGNQTIDELATLTLPLTATDPDAGDTLTFSLVGTATPGLSINATTGHLTFTPTEAQGPSTINVTVRVADEEGLTDDESFSITVNEVNQGPTLAAIANRTANIGDTVTFTATATDADLPAQSLTFSLETGAPAGATINAQTGAFSWTTPDTQATGDAMIGIRVTDSLGGTEVKTFTVTVAQPNRAPVLTSPGNQTIDELATLDLALSATDPDAGDVLAFSLVGTAIPGLSINATTGQLAFTPTEAQGPSTINVTVRVTDDEGLNDEETFTVTINEVNQAPVLTAIADRNANIGDTVTFTATATDADLPAQTLAFSLETGSPTGATIDAQTGAFSWTFPDNQAIGPVTIGVRVTDSLGGFDVEEFIVGVQTTGALATLAEGSNFLQQATLGVPTDGLSMPGSVRVDLTRFLDQTDSTSAAEDSFVVSLLDDGEFVSTVFTQTGDDETFTPGLVRFDGTSLWIDNSAFAGLNTPQLQFQLINSDGDEATTYAIFDLSIEPSDNDLPTIQFTMTDDTVTAGGSTDLTSLTATTDLALLIENVRFDAATGEYRADARLRNQGSETFGRNNIVVFDGLPNGVEFTSASGVTGSGQPYVNFSPAIPNGGLAPGQTSSSIEIVISNPTQLRFSLVPTILTGGMNRAPVLGSLGTLTVMPGATLTVDIDVTDADGDQVMLSIASAAPLPNVSLAGRQIKIQPSPDQLGTYTFDLIARDGSTETRQTLTIDVVADPNTMTRVSGRVLNTNEQPIAGIAIQLGRFQTITDAQGFFTLELPSFVTPTESFDIEVPTGDQFFDPSNTGSAIIELRRAGFDVTTGESTDNPRRHANIVTAFLDGSVVYGSDDTRAMALRTMTGGQLRISEGNLLPFNSAEFFPDGMLENENSGRHDPADLFAAGDVRANDNVQLASLQTLLVREHNRKATELAASNPALNDEQLYQAARKWVGALLQHITYNEFLPLLLGQDAIPAYSGYDASVDPQISGVFSTAAFRIGHTMANDDVLRLDENGQSLNGGSLTLREAFFNPDPVVADGIEPFLLGMIGQQTQEVDAKLIDGLRNFLFGPPGAGGLDLISLNIQRGLDLGLPSYNQARIDFGLAPATSFADISSSASVQQELASVYDSVDDVDLIVGGLAEDHVTGGTVGALFQAILLDQFLRTRDGDRFWYENGQFSDSELAEIRNTTLSSLILNNTDITNLPDDVFTTGMQTDGPTAGGNSGSASDLRSLNGTGNNTGDPSLGSKGENLLVNYTLDYGDGISTPAGEDRPGAREISNGVFDQSGSIPNSDGLTAMFMIWGQLLAHDLSLTPGGTDNTIKILGDTFTGLESYPFIAKKVPLLFGRPVYPGVNNIIDRPIYLPVLDMANAVTINPNVDTIVTTAAIPNMSVMVQAGTLQDRSGNLFTGQLSITEVPRDRTPANLPGNLRPDLVVTIQPAEMVFTQPAAITFPNSGGWAPGTIMDLWSINPISGEFEDVGDMKVSADGSVIETISGGIRNSAWHFPSPRAPELRPIDADVRNEDDGCVECKATAPATSEVELHSGAVIENHSLVGYQSLGRTFSLDLRYDSLRADPRPIVHFGQLQLTALEGELFFATLRIRNNGSVIQVPGYTGNDFGLRGGEHFWRPDEQGGESYAALQADLTDFSSGIFEYEVESGQLILGTGQLLSGSSSRQIGELQIVNSITSPFGAGWGLSGLEQVIETLNGDLLLVNGDGSERRFERSNNSYKSPPGDFSTIEKLNDGGFVRTMTDQTTYHYSTSGQVTAIVDRNGNTTSFEYDEDGTIARIADAAGLATTFVKLDGRIIQIVDPANRTTSLDYDSRGNLIRITDPDGSSRTFEYDERHHLTSEIDKRGFREEMFYSFAGRAERAIKKDGTEIFFQPLQTQILLPPTATIDPLNAPSLSLFISNRAQYTDSNGNVTEARLDRAGQSLQFEDSQGSMGSTIRNSQNLPVRVSDSRGFTSEYSYDDSGNLVSLIDRVSSLVQPGYPILDDPVITDSSRYFYITDEEKGQFATRGVVVNEPGVDLASEAIDLGFDIEFFGESFNQIYVDYLGAVSFDGPLREPDGTYFFDPHSFAAPLFFDNRQLGLGSFESFVEFGRASISGHKAFIVRWTLRSLDSDETQEEFSEPKYNIFELAIIDRSDLGSGQFDLEFNYQTLEWGQELSPISAYGVSGQRVELLGGSLTGSLNSQIDGRYRAYLRKGSDSFSTQTFEYDPTFSRLTHYVDGQGRTTLQEIDPSNGNVLKRTQVIGRPDDLQNGETDDLVTSFTYTAYGLIGQIRDPLGRITEHGYDTFGRLTRITYALGTAVEASRFYEYDEAGNVIAQVDENGNRSEFAYDAMNRLIRSVEADPDGSGPLSAPESQLSYDASGYVIQTIDANGSTTVNSYDSLNRLVATNDQNGNQSRYRYDNFGNLVESIDPLRSRVGNQYDGRNRITRSRAADGGVTRFIYDGDDNLTSLVDPVGNSTSYRYDARNRVVQEIDPLGNSTSYVYDASDNLLVKTDRNGQIIEYTYDDANRLILEKWLEPDGIVVQNEIRYTYDKASNLLGVVSSNLHPYRVGSIDQSSALTFTYDERNRLKTVDNTGTPFTTPVIIEYEYDNVGNVLSVTESMSGSQLTTTYYDYDALNRAVGVTQSGDAVEDKRVDFAYNQLGQYLSIKRFSDLAGNSLVAESSYGYDSLNRLTRLQHTDSADNILAFYDFAYDADSRIISIGDTDGVTNYSYNLKDELTGADREDEDVRGDELYLYDANGNRLKSHLNSTYEIGPSNRLRRDEQYLYIYDDEGNLTSRDDLINGGFRDFEWDYRNRLIAIRDFAYDPDQHYDASNVVFEVQFAYDAFDRRIVKSVDADGAGSDAASATYFVYDREDVILDLADSDGPNGLNSPVVDVRYLHGPGVDQVLAQEGTDSQLGWLLTDHLGSTREIVNDNAVRLAHIGYDSYGNVIETASNLANSRYLFTGREFDSETGLNYYRARYYENKTGRFISEDPLSFRGGSRNLFEYVGNSPNNYADPSGMIGELPYSSMPFADRTLYTVQSDVYSVNYFVFGFSYSKSLITNTETGRKSVVTNFGIGPGFGLSASHTFETGIARIVSEKSLAGEGKVIQGNLGPASGSVSFLNDGQLSSYTGGLEFPTRRPSKGFGGSIQFLLTYSFVSNLSSEDESQECP